MKFIHNFSWNENVGKTINWQLYNKSLINRGNITFWISGDISKKWYSDTTGKRGAQYLYSEHAIESTLILRHRFQLTLRSAQGFMESLVKLMDLQLKVPNYTTVCRRTKSLSIDLETVGVKSNIHVVIDSTGLKVFGEGEWKVRQHGVGKRRTWRKLHLGIDESTGQIVAQELTTNALKDNEPFDGLLDQVKNEIEQISGDGAYDAANCYDRCIEEGINLVAPPRRGAKLKNHGNLKDAPHPRDLHIREIRSVGRKRWKKNNNYHRRSLAETGMYRFKTILGDNLSCRKFENQKIESLIKCNILNRMSTPSTLVA